MSIHLNLISDSIKFTTQYNLFLNKSRNNLKKQTDLLQITQHNFSHHFSKIIIIIAIRYPEKYNQWF